MVDTIVSYAGLDPVEVIYALWKHTKAVGFGKMHDRPDLTIEQLRVMIENDPTHKKFGIGFDYLLGRPLKINLNEATQTFDSRLFDRDADEAGFGQLVIDELRERLGK